MSAAQIIAERPKLSPTKLLSVRRRLIEIDEENEDIAACDAATLEGARMLDRLDQVDGGR